MIPNSYKLPSTRFWCLETPPLCFMSKGPLPFWYQNRSDFPDWCCLGVGFLFVVIFFTSFQSFLFPGSKTHKSTSNSYSPALCTHLPVIPDWLIYPGFPGLKEVKYLHSMKSNCVMLTFVDRKAQAEIFRSRAGSGVPVSRCPCLPVSGASTHICYMEIEPKNEPGHQHH